MENASKALIIAGAILLSILIISLGIFIFQQAKGAVDTNQLDEVQVNAFNGKFDSYLGEKIRGAQVNALVNQINTNNLATDDTSKQVTLKSTVQGLTLTGTSAGGDYAKIFKTGETYKVKPTAHTNSGLISEITVSK